MKTLIWKIRYALGIRKLLCLNWRTCWDMAGSGLENVNGDTSESPKECADDEYQQWVQDSDLSLL